MPALSRSFHSVSLNVLSSSDERGSDDVVLKSGAASRTLSTPRPVPVRIQSPCANDASASAMIAGKRIRERLSILFLWLPLCPLRFSLVQRLYSNQNSTETLF